MTESGPLMAYLQPEGDGWAVHVRLPGTQPRDWPHVTFPAGPGPDVTARAFALAELGYATVRDDHGLNGWEWCEVRPTRGVHLVGRAEVRSLSAGRGTAA